jgi:hypothetical protein
MMVEDVPGVDHGMTVVLAASKGLHRPLCQRVAESPVMLKVEKQMVNRAIGSK